MNCSIYKEKRRKNKERRKKKEMDNTLTKKNRNLGNNYSLAWPISFPDATENSSDLHMTLVYINNVKRGFEQNRLKELVNAFFDDQEVPETLLLNVGAMLTDRSVLLQSEYVENLRGLLEDFLKSHGFNLRQSMPLHVDLRGSDIPSNIKEILIRTRVWNW